MPIPKTLSTPRDRSVPTLLDKLPPEIRNTIYELLLRRNAPVLLHNAAAFHTIPPDPRTRLVRMESYYEDIEQEMISGEAFRHSFEGTTSILLTCRQMYHEAAGVLYGKNSFTISRAGDGHDHDCWYEDYMRDQRS